MEHFLTFLVCSKGKKFDLLFIMVVMFVGSFFILMIKRICSLFTLKGKGELVYYGG